MEYVDISRLADEAMSKINQIPQRRLEHALNGS